MIWNMFFAGKCGPYNWYKYDNSEIIFEWVWVCAGVALLALLTPVLAKQNVWIIFAVRLVQVIMINIRQNNQMMSIVGHWVDSEASNMLQGGLEAFAFPSLNHMSCQWVPEKEKSAFLSFAFVGGTFGSIITNPMCGAIIASLGWEVSTDSSTACKPLNTQPHFSRLCSMWLEESV